MRIRQKMRLARYGRQSVFEWEHREVAELNAYDEVLVEMIQRENEPGRRSEDR